LFVSVVLTVGLSLVYFSFQRVTSIIRSAASTFIDKVAEHAAGSLDTQFKDVRDNIELLTMLPSVQQDRIDDPGTYTLMACAVMSSCSISIRATATARFSNLTLSIAPDADFATSCTRQPMQSFGFS
jgi:hypothetical protein